MTQRRGRATNIPATRMWARLDRFECECPACGHILTPFARRKEPPPPRPLGKRPHRAGARYDIPRWKLQWNPHTQRLRCIACNRPYICGLLVYPAARGSTPTKAPEDTRPTARQRLELRQFAQGFYAERTARNGEPVNVYVDFWCTCPPPPAWCATCPIHGSHRLHKEVAKPTTESTE